MACAEKRMIKVMVFGCGRQSVDFSSHLLQPPRADPVSDAACQILSAPCITSNHITEKLGEV